MKLGAPSQILFDLEGVSALFLTELGVAMGAVATGALGFVLIS